MDIEIAGTPNRFTQIALDNNFVAYRPRLNYVIDNVHSTLLLCQAMYWATHMSNPFYKFISPCGHELYKIGDSWTEELSFSRHEFLGAIKRIARRINVKTSLYDPESYLWYWTDMSRLTWYMVNWNRVNAAIELAYPVNPESGDRKIQKVDLRKSEKRTYINPESGLSIYKENQRITTKSNYKESSSSDHVVTSSFDDDDLFNDLKEIGLSPSLALEIISSNPREVVIRKVKDIMGLFVKGKINNLLGYTNRVFTQPLYSPKQIEAIMTANKDVHAGLVDSAQMELPDISSISADVCSEYVNQLPVHLRRIHSARGMDSVFLRIGLIEYASKEESER